MVARDDIASDAGPTLGTRAAAFFLAWRRLLTRALAVTRRPARACAEALPRALTLPALLARFAAYPQGLTEERDRRRVAACGGASLAAGVLLSLALAPRLRVPAAEAAVAAAWTLAWAGMRLGILRATTRLSRRALLAAWTAGLLPAVLGVTDVLRLLALAASAWLTIGALKSAGAEVREARRAVAWAVGAEGLAAALRWLGGGLLLYAVR